MCTQIILSIWDFIRDLKLILKFSRLRTPSLIEIRVKINLVRDPIEQFISHFNFKRNGDFAKQHANNPDKFSALNYVS